MKNTFLLVDNVVAFERVYRKAVSLGGIDCEIESVSNGLEALSIINKYLRRSSSLFDFIFIELDMPVMDSLEFIRIFKGVEFHHKDKINIVIRSAFLHAKDKERAIKLGIDYVISKPLTDEELIDILS